MLMQGEEETAGTNRKISLFSLLRIISELLNYNIWGSTLNPDTKTRSQQTGVQNYFNWQSEKTQLFE
jgi:hypothetical protein